MTLGTRCCDIRVPAIVILGTGYCDIRGQGLELELGLESSTAGSLLVLYYSSAGVVQEIAECLQILWCRCSLIVVSACCTDQRIEPSI